MKEQTLEIQVARIGLQKKINAIQGDSGRVIRCIMADLAIKQGDVARLYAVKPGGSEIYNSCAIRNGEVIVELTNQTLADVGNVFCQIEIARDGKRVTTFEFSVDVKKSLVNNSAIESKDEFTALELALEEARQIGNPKFTEATTRENIESNESMGTLFGKIKKWFADLKAAAFCNVANNLITNVSGSVLDARQGAALSTSIGNLSTTVDTLNRNLDLTNSRRLWQRDYYLNAADINGTKDMLSVGTVDFYSGVSRNLFLNIQAADIAIWTGLPTTIAGFKIPWIGERLVMPRTSTGTAAAHIKLELREWYPVPGRVFTIFFNYGKWSAWNVVTPVKD